MFFREIDSPELISQRDYGNQRRWLHELSPDNVYLANSIADVGKVNFIAKSRYEKPCILEFRSIGVSYLNTTDYYLRLKFFSSSSMTFCGMTSCTLSGSEKKTEN